MILLYRLIGFLVFIPLIVACTSVYVSQKKYSLKDQVIIKHYLIESRSSLGDQDYEFDVVDYDSIFNLFKESVKLVDLNFIFKEGENQVYTEHFQIGKLRFEDIDKSKLIALGEEDTENLVLIPVISIKNNYKNTHGQYKDISESDFLSSPLFLTIYLLHENKIIYASSSYTAPQSSNPYHNPVPTNKIHTQEDWEIITKKVFRKYLKRLNEK